MYITHTHTRTPETNLLCFLLLMGRVPLLSISIKKKRHYFECENEKKTDENATKRKKNTICKTTSSVVSKNMRTKNTTPILHGRSFLVSLILQSDESRTCHHICDDFFSFSFEIVEKQ